MTDLLHRLAARAAGHRQLPTTVPLLPPRLAAEPLSGEHLGPSVEDGVPEDAGSAAAVPARDGGASGRGTGTARLAQDHRPVPVPATPQQAPPAAARPVVEGDPLPSPAADPPGRGGSTDAGRSDARRDSLPPRRRPDTPAIAPVETVVAPIEAPGALPPPVHSGGSPAAPDGLERREPRPRPRPVAPEHETARPTRRLVEAPAVPVARPVPVPTPVLPRSAEPASLTAGEDPAPAVTISIGRVEIRAVPPAPNAPVAREAEGSPSAGAGRSSGTLTLGDFLRGTGDAR
ncbi:hypothetical protein ACGFMM_00435 [Streptomyces sp. NPDC048604]|uniref:hypothetical protein n=1 Tax=Streptomyces sp. NPDC048604 TaxID=3365578 RepID=UPI00371DD3C9